MTLNPADSRPLYAQLAELLRARIRAGELQPGSQTPTEADLADRYGASRNTVRLALGALRAEGLIISERGKGTFIRAEPPMRYHASMTGSRRKRLEADRRHDTFTEQVKSQGKTPRQISTVEIIAADDEIAGHLQLTPREQVAVRRRLMLADEEPLQLGDSYYPLAIVSESKIMTPANIAEGTDQVLEDLGHTPTRYEDEITWRMPTAEEAISLHIVPGTPIGRLVRTTFDQLDRPVEVYVVIMPADRHVMLYEVPAE